MSIHRKGGLPAMCSSGPRGWVRLRLKGGTWLGGAFVTRADGIPSYAAGYPERQDLYLVESVEVDPETGSFLLDDEGTPVSRGSSILIRRPDQLPARRSRRTTRRRSSCWSPSPRRVRDCSGHLERLGPEGSDRDGIGHTFERDPGILERAGRTASHLGDTSIPEWVSVGAGRWAATRPAGVPISSRGTSVAPREPPHSPSGPQPWPSSWRGRTGQGPLGS